MQSNERRTMPSIVRGSRSPSPDDRDPVVVSLTPAVFHLPEAVNAASRSYGARPIVPRGPRFRPLLDEARAGIVRALGTREHEAILLTGSGTTSMAAVLGSCLEPRERLLVVRNGAYGDRILELAKTLSQPVLDLERPYGERPDLERVEALAREGAFDAVAMVYGATSTCSLNPVRELAEITKRHGKKLLLDCVSALFVERCDLEGWGAAAVMGSCNKGLHAHPNLTVSLVRRDLLDDMRSIAPRAPSLELRKAFDAQERGAHPYTIDPMSVLQVRGALEALEAEGGVLGRHAIYQARAALLREGYARLGLRVYEHPGMPLATIGTALWFPEGVRYEPLAEALATEPFEGHTFEIYAAQGKLSDRVFRIFHMGCYELDVYRLFLGALERALGRVRGR